MPKEYLVRPYFSAVDEDGSGTVSYEEFRKHMWRRYQPAMVGRCRLTVSKPC